MLKICTGYLHDFIPQHFCIHSVPGQPTDMLDTCVTDGKCDSAIYILPCFHPVFFSVPAKKTKKQVFVSYSLPSTDSSLMLLVENRIKKEMEQFPDRF